MLCRPSGNVSHADDEVVNPGLTFDSGTISGWAQCEAAERVETWVCGAGIAAKGGAGEGGGGLRDEMKGERREEKRV